MYRFLRDWSLPIAMAGGALSYLLYVNIPFFDSTHAIAADIIGILQPMLIFLMLFVTFCKVRISELKPSLWHIWLLTFQMSSFIAISLSIAFFKDMTQDFRAILEAAMLCLVCPTATAAAVITARLGGNSASLVSYTMQINMAIALAAPPFLAFSHPVEGMSLTASFLVITGKVFPLLLCPLLCAWFVRKFLPNLHALLVSRWRNLPFYLWLVALSLAIGMTSRAIAHTDTSFTTMAGIAIVSLICCLTQFAIGRWIGGKYSETIAGGQSLGQKNTVFAIWFAYTFLTPVTAIAGGFYSIWHNLVNTRQLYKKNHEKL